LHNEGFPNQEPAFSCPTGYQRVKYPPVISGFIHAYKAALKTRSGAWLSRKLNDLHFGLAFWFGQTFAKASFAKIAAEFFAEAAVLCFVFPIIDRVVAEKPITPGWVLFSISSALVFLFVAGILASVSDT
jgi:hypothetical protein